VAAVIAPLLLLDAVLVSLFWLDDPSSRVQLSVTAFVAVSAALGWAHQVIPFAIFTWLDYIILTSLALPTLLGIEVVLSDQAELIPDFVFRLLAVTLFVVLISFIVYFSVQATKYVQSIKPPCRAKYDALPLLTASATRI
jgi:hypothetical protein